MNTTRLVYKSHKWLAVGVGLLTFLWFVSGIVMVLPQNLISRPPASAAAPPQTQTFRDATVTVPQAIVALETSLGHPVNVNEIGFRSLEAKLFYQISTAKNGTHLVNVVDGTRFVITQGVARQLAVRAAGGAGSLGEISLLRAYDSDYTRGPLPAYRVPANDGANTIYYVTGETGEVRSTNRLGRIRRFITGLHVFAYLAPWMSKRSIQVALVVASAVGAAMAILGVWILWIQLKNWRLARRA